MQVIKKIINNKLNLPTKLYNISYIKEISVILYNNAKGDNMNKNIIIAILVVIIIAAAAALMFGHTSGKMTTQINFLNNEDTFQNGEQVIFELKDANGSAIAGETVKVTFNSNETFTVVTDNDGKGYLLISGENEGKYEVLAEYSGNDKYDATNAKVTITITSDAPDNPVTQPSSNSVANTQDNNNNGSSNNQTPDNPTSNRYFIPQYEIWVENGVVVDGPIGIGMTLDDWIATYTPANPHFDDPDDPYNPYYDPDHPYPGDQN